jgi:hypothetical protein
MRLCARRTLHPPPSATSTDYGVSRDIFNNSWIVYLHRKEIFGLISSAIVVLARESGHVLYFGSANDEG